MLPRTHKSRRGLRIFLSVAFVTLIVAGYLVYRWYGRSGERVGGVMAFIRNAQDHQGWVIDEPRRRSPHDDRNHHQTTSDQQAYKRRDIQELPPRTI